MPEVLFRLRQFLSKKGEEKTKIEKTEKKSKNKTEV